jgi:glucosamine 6-phosphate synthetase-like amidotransferase/phosphosugar isomerase protein
MCGIVGFVGRGPAAAPILDALKRLEYRGYDSAGIATLEGGLLTRRRAVGKLVNLGPGLRASRLPVKSASDTPDGRRTGARTRKMRSRTRLTALR